VNEPSIHIITPSFFYSRIFPQISRHPFHRDPWTAFPLIFLNAICIDERKYIDQHYYSIASKATLLHPKELNVPTDKFAKQFGLKWEDALRQGVVFNAMQACQKLGITADELDKKWAAAKKV